MVPFYDEWVRRLGGKRRIRPFKNLVRGPSFPRTRSGKGPFWPEKVPKGSIFPVNQASRVLILKIPKNPKTEVFGQKLDLGGSKKSPNFISPEPRPTPSSGKSGQKRGFAAPQGAASSGASERSLSPEGSTLSEG